MIEDEPADRGGYELRALGERTAQPPILWTRAAYERHLRRLMALSSGPDPQVSLSVWSPKDGRRLVLKTPGQWRRFLAQFPET